MAGVDQLDIKVNGKQAHGANPWAGVDPIVIASQIVMGLQTIVSRSVNISENPAVVTVGAIHSGIRQNIIPESAHMIGTIRTFDPAQRELVHRRINEIATNIASLENTFVKLSGSTMFGNLVLRLLKKLFL